MVAIRQSWILQATSGKDLGILTTLLETVLTERSLNGSVCINAFLNAYELDSKSAKIVKNFFS